MSEKSTENDGMIPGALLGPEADKRLEQMISHASAVICDNAQPLADLPKSLARFAPDAPALEVTLALASAANAIQSVLGTNGDSGRRAQGVWRQAAMVAVEVHYLTVTGLADPRAADLLRHWAQDEDGSDQP